MVASLQDGSWWSLRSDFDTLLYSPYTLNQGWLVWQIEYRTGNVWLWRLSHGGQVLWPLPWSLGFLTLKRYITRPLKLPCRKSHVVRNRGLSTEPVSIHQSHEWAKLELDPPAPIKPNDCNPGWSECHLMRYLSQNYTVILLQNTWLIYVVRNNQLLFYKPLNFWNNLLSRI